MTKISAWRRFFPLPILKPDTRGCILMIFLPFQKTNTF